MEALPNDIFLEFFPNTLEAVREVYELEKPGAMEDAVDILNIWIQKQNHFTKKKFNKDYLERLIIANKGSVERTKNRLDRHFTIRTMMPELFKDYDARYDFDSMQDIVTMVILPKITKSYDRVCLIKPVGKKFSTKILQESHSYSLLLMEYYRGYDYARSIHVVIDYMDVSFTELLAVFDLIDLRQLVVALMDGYGLRVKGVHLLMNSKVIEIVLTIAKQILSDKIKNRLHIHKNIRLNCFIITKMMKIFCTEDFREYWREMKSARTDETLRQGDTFNDQYMGMPGTFRSLSVD